MSRGRPNISEQLVLDYIDGKSDRTLDRQLDERPLRALAKQRGLPSFELASVIKRMHAKSVLHPLQHGRWVLSPDAMPMSTPRLGDLDLAADAVLRRLDMEYYLSWHSALWHHGLIDQQSRLHLRRGDARRKRPVTARARRASASSPVTERKFFGATRVEDFEWPVWVASRREGPNRFLRSASPRRLPAGSRKCAAKCLSRRDPRF